MGDINRQDKRRKEMGIWKPCVLSGQFFYKPKTAVGDKLFFQDQFG